ncbi:MAG: LytTR family DNA-binding domain-containing protein [Gemmatimonadales bacterium]
MPTPERAGTIRALIVDDEPLARDCIRLALRREPDVEVVGECGDGAAAVSAIRQWSPDLVFLDVQMPGLDGFGVVEEIGADRMPAVVFVTAYDAHAIPAFRLHAADYLLKPFDDARFAEAVSHVRRQLRQARDSALARRLEALLDDVRSTRDAPPPRGTYATRVLVRQGEHLEFLPMDTVDWIETAGNYVRLHAGARVESVRTTLAALLTQLDPAVFVRIHRSAVVNVTRVRALHPWYGGDYTATLTYGRELRVSRHYRDALLKTVS